MEKKVKSKLQVKKPPLYQEQVIQLMLPKIMALVKLELQVELRLL